MQRMYCPKHFLFENIVNPFATGLYRVKYSNVLPVTKGLMNVTINVTVSLVDSFIEDMTRIGVLAIS